MVFTLGKIFLSDKSIIPFESYNAPGRAKIGTFEVMLQYKLSFSDVRKASNDQFSKCNK